MGKDMEVSQSEMNESTIEEKNDFEAGHNLKSTNKNRPLFNVGFVEKGLWVGVILFGLNVFFCDHILGRNMGTYGVDSSLTQNQSKNTVK